MTIKAQTDSEQSVTLPRAVCPICERDVAVRRGGELREHAYEKGGEMCAGSGYTLEQIAREAGIEVDRLRRIG